MTYLHRLSERGQYDEGISANVERFKDSWGERGIAQRAIDEGGEAL
ncbi:hypothetical protein PT2222_40285 [Paraburkholderia tropica]